MSNPIRESISQNCTVEIVDGAVECLSSVADADRVVSISERIALCQECIESVFREAEAWTEAAVKAKGLLKASPLRAEDVLSGPVVVIRQLQLTIQTLRNICGGGRPRLPGPPQRLTNGQLAVPVFPTRGFFDNLTFMGLSGHVRMQPGVELPDLHGNRLGVAGEGRCHGTVVVLGAGNVSSIPATDSLNRIMFEGRRVVLKMNPVNEYLAPVFQRAFAPLIRENLLTIVTGGADVGAKLVSHEDVNEVHITGSAETHDAIVWGTDPQQRAERKRMRQPVLQKTITSELGNVTPWIIVPGQYTARQLDSQARHLAASITNNVSFNCLATKAIITWDQWSQREEFLALIRRHLDATPLRPAYYPGAAERYRLYSGQDISPDENGALPWTLLPSQKYDERPELFREESFVCVCAETGLNAASPESFLEAATDFVNNQMTGTLCASVTIPPKFRKSAGQTLERCLERLRYGSVCVNQWSGLAYGFTSPPWGAYPGATLEDVQSGIGSVHNTYLLDNFEKTVLAGPLINFPKPVWFPDHKHALNVANGLLRLFHQPSVARLPALFTAAALG